jgi:hypothetical protein
LARSQRRENRTDSMTYASSLISSISTCRYRNLSCPTLENPLMIHTNTNVPRCRSTPNPTTRKTPISFSPSNISNLVRSMPKKLEALNTTTRHRTPSLLLDDFYCSRIQSVPTRLTMRRGMIIARIWLESAEL